MAIFTEEEIRGFARKAVELGNVSLVVQVPCEDGETIEPPVDPIDPPVDTPAPDTRLIEMTAKEQYKKPDERQGDPDNPGYDASGKPIMEYGIVGFKAEIGDRFLVEIPSIQASGGAQYYKVWIGDNNDQSARGWYVARDKTKVI